MNGTIKVNFHCHSNFSDGSLPPEKVAAVLAVSDVRYASLVDHDTLEGQSHFRAALHKRQIGFVSGVEISVLHRGVPMHILGYGFDLGNHEFRATIQANLKNRGTAQCLTAAEAITSLHAAGGKAFLAHPLSYGLTDSDLQEICASLSTIGLDGLEVYYAAYSPVQRARLLSLAQKHRFIPSAGSDFHSPHVSPLDEAFVDFPWESWIDFRDALGLTAIHQRRKPEKSGYVAWAASMLEKRIRKEAEKPNFQRFAFRIFLPALFTLALLVLTFWFFVIPTFEAQLLARKREMIRELTNSAWSVLQKYHSDEQNGLLSAQEAQRRALSDIAAIRYGDEQKDYFWVTDLKPNMLMHPYRSDLNGTDVSEFQDSGGKRVFVEFVNTVKTQESGYVEYQWQWKDNADKIVPKESYVKIFIPWNWVIGTGIYIEDVVAEINRIEQKIIFTSLAALAVVAFLMVYILRQSLFLEEQRVDAVNALKDSRDRYRALVEASSEGNFMIIEDQCVFSSHKFLEMMEYNEREMPSLALSDLMFESQDLEFLKHSLAQAEFVDAQVKRRFETRLRTRTGRCLEVVLSATPILIEGKSGFVFSVREARVPSWHHGHDSLQNQEMMPALNFLRFGVLRVSLSKGFPILDANVPARHILGFSPQCDVRQKNLLDSLLPSPKVQEFFSSLMETGFSKMTFEKKTNSTESRFWELEAKKFVSDANEALFAIVTIDDVTERERNTIERESLLQEMHHIVTPFLKNLEGFAKNAPVVNATLSCKQALSRLLRTHSDFLLVSDESGQNVLGIVWLRSIFDKFLDSQGALENTPVYEVMQAPLSRLSGGASVSEAVGLLSHENAGVVLLDEPIEGGWRAFALTDFYSTQLMPISVFPHDYKNCQRLESLSRLHERHQTLLQYGFESGSDAAMVTRHVSWESDLVVNAIFRFAFKELGEPPVPFAFVALGSQGRGEQTFRTDQDNAIIFGDGPKEVRKSVEEYFLRLGNYVCHALDQVGYPFCRGNVMARNPRWVMPLSDWVKTFAGWIRLAEPQALLEFNMFFDFRTVYGEDSLVAALRRDVAITMHETPTFFMHLAENALRYKPPMSLFGNLIVGENAENPSALNIKDAMLPITNFARLYSLKGKIPETNTLKRLSALHAAGVLTKSTHEELQESYTKLLELRLKHQVSALRRGLVPNNSIDPRDLSSFDKVVLKQAFTAISTMLKKISFDFLGGSV